MTIQDFLDLYGKNTQKSYRCTIKAFLNSVDNRKMDIEEKATKYFAEHQNYEKNINRFYISLKNKPPKTIKLNLAGTKSFLKYNKVELSESFWKTVKKRIKGSKALTIDRPPTTQELRQILSHCNIKGKSLFMVLASSGMRIGEALQLEIDDIDLNSNPAKIVVRGLYSKTGNNRVTYISSEAKEALLEWLKVRGRNKKPRNNRIWGISSDTARFIWKLALEKAGLLDKDKRTGRVTIHPHTLRKFFRSQMSMKIPVDIVEALMGHEGYLTEVYRRHTPKQLGEFYLKAEPKIAIFRDTHEITENQEKMIAQNKRFMDKLIRLEDENSVLKRKMEKIEKERFIPTEELLEMISEHLLNNPKILEKVFAGKFQAVEGKVKVVKKSFNTSMYR